MPISISCPHCLRPYQFADALAGRRVECEECGNQIAVPGVVPPATETSQGGSAIFRHRPKPEPAELAFEATPFLPLIERHIERTIGPAPMVFHEVVSLDIHLDLHIVPPTNEPPSEDHPFGTSHYTIVTSGLSSRPMNLPEELDPSYRYAELMIALPSDWPGLNPDGTFDDDAMKDDANWWPVRCLKALARLPHEYSTFLGPGHTIPNGDPAEPYSPATDLCCMMVVPPLLAPEAGQLVINDDMLINFYALCPLYLEEMDFKLHRGLEPLANKLAGASTTELIDPARRNVCKRRLWPFGGR